MSGEVSDAVARRRLVEEVRVLREALHHLVLCAHRDRTTWAREMTALAERERLTPPQRQRFQQHLRSYSSRKASAGDRSDRASLIE